MHAGLISLKDVTKRFFSGSTEVFAISQVSLTIPAGSFCVLAGASGSGKTTLLNLMGGLEQVTSGTIAVGARKLDQMNEQALALFRRHQVGYIFQGNNLISTLTALENVEIPLVLTQTVGHRALAAAALADVGLAGKQNSFPHFLSIGEQQRIAIARAMVHAPAIVLADEPTANLDSRTGGRILSLLQKMNQNHGCTIIISTHDPQIIEKHKTVIHLADGQIVQGLEG
jgi:putative ABC transport system ATP-binding protein